MDSLTYSKLWSMAFLYLWPDKQFDSLSKTWPVKNNTLFRTCPVISPLVQTSVEGNAYVHLFGGIVSSDLTNLLVSQD